MSYNNKQWPIGNCPVDPPKPIKCRMNIITKNNQILNKFSSIPQELLIQESFLSNSCQQQTLIQPELNVGSNCKPNFMTNMSHQWANLSPNEQGGYVRLVKKKKDIVKPVMGKIDIPNYFWPPYTTQ